MWMREKKTLQREKKLIFDFFLQKKNQKSTFSLSTPFFWAKHFPNDYGLIALET
jgi:hypothetical protein